MLLRKKAVVANTPLSNLSNLIIAFLPKIASANVLKICCTLGFNRLVSDHRSPIEAFL